MILQQLFKPLDPTVYGFCSNGCSAALADIEAPVVVRKDAIAVVNNFFYSIKIKLILV